MIVIDLFSVAVHRVSMTLYQISLIFKSYNISI